MKLLVIASCFLACVACANAADIADRSWTFTQDGNYLGWVVTNQTASGVASGALWATNAATAPSVSGPADVALAARSNHYVQIRMRERLASGSTDRFGASIAKIYFATEASPAFNETNKVQFKSFGNGEWKTYNIRTGAAAGWTGNIRQIRVDPHSAANARLEIAWIKIMQDVTPPSFIAEHQWSYSDADSIKDNTPSISLKQTYDEVSGVLKAEFFKRPAASTSESDWVLDGTDTNATNGLQRRYAALAAGSYDLGVKVYDKAGNVGYWVHDDDNWIDDLTINPSLATRIDVNAADVRNTISRDVYGNNIHWDKFGPKYDPATGLLPSSLEQLMNGIDIPVLRYPGGCFSDTFFWKKSIGPLASRANQYLNPCAPYISNAGPVKFGVDEFLRLCERKGYAPMFTLRYRWETAAGLPGVDPAQPYAAALADAVDLVEYCNAPNNGSNPNGGTDWAAVRAANGHPQPYNLKLFELGNEPFGPDPWGSPGKLGLDGASLHALDFIKFSAAMKAVDPTIRVVPSAYLNEQTSEFDFANPKWAYSLYSQIGPYLTEAQYHAYYPYNGKQTNYEELYKETMASAKALDEALDMHRAAQRLAMPDRQDFIKLWISEFTVTYNWANNAAQQLVNEEHTRSLKSALAMADMIRVLLVNDDIVSSAQWWLLYTSSAWGAIAEDDQTVFPIYHVYRAYTKHFGDKIVGSKVVGSSTFDYASIGGVLPEAFDLTDLAAIASKSSDGQSVYLMVINRSKANTITSQVNVSNFLAGPVTEMDTETWVINGPNVDDYDNPTSVTTSQTTSRSGSSFSYSFAPHSITSFKFTPVAAHYDPPAAHISGPSLAVTNTGPVSFDVEYENADAVSLTPAMVSLARTGTANATVSVTGSGPNHRTVTLSQITGNGSLSISIAADSATGPGGAAPGAGPSAAVTVDNAAPSVQIGLPSILLTSTGPVNYVITYTGASNITLTPAKVVLSKTGSANAVVQVSGSGSSTRTVSLTSITGNGTLGITISAGTAVDEAGNLATAAGPGAMVSVDNTPPTVTISAPSPAVTASGPVAYTVSFSGASTVNLQAGSVTLNKTGTANGFVAVSGSGSSARTVTLSSLTGSGTLSISIATGVAVDNVGNASAAAGPSQQVTVDNSGPSAPIVTDEGAWTPFADRLSASWSGAYDPAGITGYQYAIGTTPSTQNVRGWTSAGSGTSVRADGLSLTMGTQYFIQIRAKDTFGAYGAAGVSDGIRVAPVINRIGELWDLQDGTAVALVSKVVTASNGAAAWLEETDRSAAIRLSGECWFTEGDEMTLAGTMATVNGNRQIITDVIEMTGSGSVPEPVSMSQVMLGGRGYNVRTPGIPACIHVYNLGLLVRIWGTVTCSDSSDPDNRFFCIDDGSGLVDGDGRLGVKVRVGSDPPPQGGFVVATGIVVSETVGGQASPVILARYPQDLVVYELAPPSLSISGPSEPLTRSGPVSYDVTYTNASSITLGVSDVSIAATGSASGVLGVSSTGPSTRRVTISNITGSGSLAISIAAGTATSPSGQSAPAAGPSPSFTVDNSGPAAVAVADEGSWTPSTTALRATWTAASDPAGIARYEYAIGTASGGVQIRSWTSAGTGLAATASGLDLDSEQRYYISVRAVDTLGNIGSVGSSDGITVADDAGTVGEALSLGNWQGLALKDKVVTATGSGCFWIEEASRATGLKVISSKPIARGSTVSVAGTLGLMEGVQRVLYADVVEPGTAGVIPEPLGLTHVHLGGSSLNFRTPGITGAQGLYNLGLLVKTWGWVTGGSNASLTDRYFYLCDGSALFDDSGNRGVRVNTGSLTAPLSGFKQVIGVVGARQSGGRVVPFIEVVAPDGLLSLD